MKKSILKKLWIRIYDKFLVLLLFSSLFITSCNDPEPTPEYGAPVPMYGVVPAQIDNQKDKI